MSKRRDIRERAWAQRQNPLAHGDYAAPFQDVIGTNEDGTPRMGPEYMPVSPRTGRAVAQATAQREYRESFDSVPYMEAGQVGGLWDYERGAEGSARPVKPTEPRYDTAEMAEFFRRHGNELTGHQWEVYTRFWVERKSYTVIARALSTSRSNVQGTVQVLRRKMATRVLVSQQHTGQVRCPRCQAKSEVTKVRHGDAVTTRDRLCLECKQVFQTEEKLKPPAAAE